MIYYGKLKPEQQEIYLKVVNVLRDFFPLISAESCILLTDAIMTVVMADEFDLASSEGQTIKTLAERNEFFKAIEHLARATSNL